MRNPLFRTLIGSLILGGSWVAVAAAAEPRTDHRGSADYKRHIVKTFVTRILTGIARSEQKAA